MPCGSRTGRKDSIMNSTFDEALERLRGTGSEVAGGVAPNHGPMAAEALVALGCDDAVVAWTDRYRRQLDTMPPPRTPVTARDWAQALGATDRFGDWVAFFRAQLAEAPWRLVFGEWIGRLLPATPSAGAHGLIRTAHALRALADAETTLRVEELGVALAYWAAYYRTLPGTPRLAGTLDLGDALLRIPLFLRGQARPGMPREVYLRVMQAHGREFSEAVDAAAEPESVEDALSSLTEAGARMYLANASSQPLVLLHTVTAPAALRLVLPHLPAALHKTALAYVWQNVAATAAAYGDEKSPERDDWPPQEPSAIIEDSIATDDPHALKFAEASIREHRLNPHPAYLAAAADWASRLHRARHWSPAERDAAGLEFR
jgi:Questin oxidase-like